VEELSMGDSRRIKEVKAWLKKGMKIPQIRKKLEKLGYNEYHIAFLLEEATGQKFVPPKPRVIISQRRLKIIGEAVALLLLVGIVVWLLFLR